MSHQGIRLTAAILLMLAVSGSLRSCWNGARVTDQPETTRPSG
jgi:hypothetical protein